MIASIENVRQFLKDCLAVDDLQAYDCCKIMSEKYGVLTCETINDYARLECIKWMINNINSDTYVDKNIVYACWIRVLMCTVNLIESMKYECEAVKTYKLIKSKYDPVEFTRSYNCTSSTQQCDVVKDFMKSLIPKFNDLNGTPIVNKELESIQPLELNGTSTTSTTSTAVKTDVKNLNV